MKNYLVKKSQYKPLEGKEIGLQAINGSKDPVTYMSDLKAMENRINSRMDNGFRELRKLILNKK